MCELYHAGTQDIQPLFGPVEGRLEGPDHLERTSSLGVKFRVSRMEEDYSSTNLISWQAGQKSKLLFS